MGESRRHRRLIQRQSKRNRPPCSWRTPAEGTRWEITEASQKLIWNTSANPTIMFQHAQGILRSDQNSNDDTHHRVPSHKRCKFGSVSTFQDCLEQLSFDVGVSRFSLGSNVENPTCAASSCLPPSFSIRVSDYRCRAGATRWCNRAKSTRCGEHLSPTPRRWRISRDASLWLPCARVRGLLRIRLQAISLI